MKKLTLDYEAPQQMQTLGISCQLADYKLIFRINKQLNIKFVRLESLTVNAGRFLGTYSLYHYYDAENELNIYLLSNKTDNGVLISDFKQLDYFLILRGEYADEEIVLSYKTQLRKVEEVLFLQTIDMEAIKNYLLFAEAFEMHIEKCTPEIP
ncbi:MAG: IPExxxVDY family protein [Bacteroidales bacterium]|nr:IPExxxVDY family protein [Bacteroidales bacterium]